MSNMMKKVAEGTGRLLLAYLLVFSQSVWAGQEQGAKDNTKAAQKAAAQQAEEKPSSSVSSAKAKSEEAEGEESEKGVTGQKRSGDGKHEGIKVHGHWTIEVRDPDGTLVTHREFENSLQPVGANYLLTCLSVGCPATLWQLQVQYSASPLACVGNSNCVMSATPSVGSIGSSTNGLVLAGTVVSNSNSAVDTVISILNGSTFGAFTKATASPTNPNFSTPIPISVGQTIAVTVVISFS